MKKKGSKSPIFLGKCWEIIPGTRVRFDFPRFHQIEKALELVLFMQELRLFIICENGRFYELE